MKPDSDFVIHDAGYGFWVLLSRNIMTKAEIKTWVTDIDPEWLSPVLRALRGQIITHKFNRLLTNLKETSRNMTFARRINGVKR